MADYLRESGVKCLWEKIKTLLSAKQDTLISGENIKTINGKSLVGEGNIEISGGGNFNESGTYPNLTVGKATKLATARTISLSGGAGGNVSFDGSANKSLDVTGLKEAYLISGGKNITYGLSLLDCVAFGERWNNRLSFYNPDYIKVEYTNNYSEDSDGNESQDVIWTNYFEDETTYNSKRQKIHLVTDGLALKGFELTGHINTPCVADKSRLRVTIDTYSGRYFQTQKITTLVARCSRNYNDQLTIERVSTKDYIDGNTEKWELVTQGQVAGDTGWNSFDAKSINYLGVSQYAGSRRVRLTYIAKTSRERGLTLGKICFIGNDVHDCEDNLAKTSHLYSWDSDKNAIFPAEIRGTKHVTIGGTAEQLVLGNGGLKKITDITDSLSYSVDNIVSKLTKGGNTTVNGNVVTTNGENRDTFFTIGTSEPIDTSIPYTLGFYIEGLTEGTRWDFNLGGIRIYGVNGYCWATGYFNSAQEGKTSITCDDGTRPSGSLSITISKITLRKGTLRGYGTDAYIKKQGTNQQAVLGDGSLKALSELSPITDADAEILLDNHIHSINVNTNGNNVNISVIESSKIGNTWETEDNDITIPLATTTSAGVMSKEDKQKIDNINYEDGTLFVGNGLNGTLSIGYESSKASSEMRVFHDRYATIHVTSYNNTSGGSIVEMESLGGKGRMEMNGDQLAELALSGAGQVRATLTKENEDGTNIKTIIDAEEGITAPKLATIGGTSEQILLGDGTLITFDELKTKLGLI